MKGTPFKAIWNFYWHSITKYGAHSPFVFDFVNNVLLRNEQVDHLSKIENERKLFLKDQSSIAFKEYGAGSRSVDGTNRRISEVAKSSLSGEWQCRLMYNMIDHYDVSNILEIGTSFGVSTSYLASSSKGSNVWTLEGNPSSAEIAESLFNRLDLSNVNVVQGEFGGTLELTLNEMKSIDAAFLDGNHRKDATLEYFAKVLRYSHSSTIIIVDDIYWSKGMNQAWEDIKNHDSVAFTIDLFRMGVVFLDKSIMKKQHFKLIDLKWKPWSIGLFG